MVPSFRSWSVRRALPLLGALTLAAAGVAPASAATAAGDSAGAALPVYDLAQCVSIALDESPSLAVAQENTLIAGKGVTQAKGAFLPNLSGGYSWQRSDRMDYNKVDLNTGLVSDEKSKYGSHSYDATTSLNVFGGMRKFGNLKSARNDLAAARHDETYSRQQVIEAVSVAYVNLLRNERLLDVAIAARDLAQRELEKTETYHRIGSAAKSDVLQAKVRSEQTRLDEVRARNAVEQSFAELAHAMNRPLSQRFEVDKSLLETNRQPGDLPTLYTEALDQRSDLKGRENAVEARAGDVTAATAGLWPSLDLFARYNRSVDDSQFHFGGSPSDTKSWGFQVNWNLFDRFATFAGRSQAKARERIAEYNLEQARLDAQLEVRQLYNSVIEAQERLSLSRETIANAEEQLRLAQERFKVGAGTMLDQITAQVNLSQARSDEIQAQCDHFIATLHLDRAVGRPLDRLAP